MTSTERRDSEHSPLWISANPRFGIVRKVVFDGPYAAKLDDLNSDYREVCLTILRRNGSDWDEIAYIDDAGYPGVGETTDYGYSGGYAFAAGRDRPRARIMMLWRDEWYPVQADTEGWWLFVRPAESPDDGFFSYDSYLRFPSD